MHTLAHQLRINPRPPPAWNCSALAGRFAELSSQGAGSALTVAFGLVFEAQAQGEPCGWVVSGQGSFFPPDAAAGGVDLAALAVIFAPGAQAAARVADKLLRSGAFGVVILDLGQQLNMPMPLQSRLAALAQEYQSVLLCLTQKGAQTPSLSSLVSLRGQTHRCALNNGRFECRVQIIKDKHGGPGWVHKEVCRATSGLC